jgi:hypothetical protein
MTRTISHWSVEFSNFQTRARSVRPRNGKAPCRHVRTYAAHCAEVHWTKESERFHQASAIRNPELRSVARFPSPLRGFFSISFQLKACMDFTSFLFVLLVGFHHASVFLFSSGRSHIRYPISSQPATVIDAADLAATCSNAMMPLISAIDRSLPEQPPCFTSLHSAATYST